MKVLVELIDSQQILNLVSAMNRKPDKVYFLSEDPAAVLPARDVVLKYLGCPYETVYYTPETLEGILQGIEADELEIDVHGGNDLAIAIVSPYAKKNGHTLCYPGFTTQTMYTVRNGELQKSDLQIPKFSVKEIIALYGGAVRDLPKAEFEGADRKAVKACNASRRYNSKVWAEFCTAMANLAKKNEGRNVWKAPESLYNEYRGVFKSLACVFRRCEVKDGSLILEFANPEYKILVTDTGLPFEYETYYQLEDSGYFDDIDIRVNIDWNGGEFNRKDPNSELDVMASKDGRLISVSCKSGKYDQQAIYEVKTNAIQFGGELAVPVLCADIEHWHSEYAEKAEMLGVLLIQYKEMRAGKAAERIVEWMQTH